MGLIARGVAAKQHILRHVVRIRLLNEESILHITGRMISRKIEHSEYMLVIIDFRTMIKRESHALEDIDNLILHDRQRMTRTQVDGIRRTCEVEFLSIGFLGLNLLAKLIDFLLRVLFQLIDLDAYCLFLVSGNIAEISHDGIDLAFLAQILQAEFLHVLGILGLEAVNFLE